MTTEANRSSPLVAEFPMNNIQDFPEILNCLSTAVAICDRKLRIFVLNPSAQLLLDISQSHACGENICQYFNSTDLRPLVTDCLENSKATTLRQIYIQDAQHRPKIIDCMLTPIVLDGVQYLALEFNEVNTVVKSLNENTVRSGQRANSAVIRAIAHEIKNPLGGLRGAAQLLERELKNRSDLQEYTRIIVKETDRLCSLVDDMSSPQIPLRLERTNIHEVLEHVRALILAEEINNIEIVRDYDPSLPEVFVDQKQLIQAFINIVRNAIEAIQVTGKLTFRTRVERFATLGASRSQTVARIDIEDDGPGVPAEIYNRIFYPMISGKPDGEGLGLSIVHQIITRHEGTIACESSPGKTCFTVLLKFAKASQT